MALNNTVWPSTGIAQEAIKEWLSTFYRLADTNNSAATEQMVDLFAEHAVVKTAAGLAQGKAAFRAIRKTAWDLIDTRKHEVLNVYIAKEDFSNMVLIGKLTAGLKNGREVVSEFVARLEFTDVESSPKATLYEVWTDTAVWKAAFASAQE